MNDEDLKRGFAELRERAVAPPFARMRAQAERSVRARRTRMGAALSAGFAIAAMVLLAIWIGWPAPEETSSMPRATLDFLLEPPSATVMSTEAPIDQIGEAW